MPIYLALILTAFNTSSMRAARVVITLFALQLGAQPFVIGLLAATFSALPVLLAWSAGRLTDRFGSRWPLLIGCVAGASASLLAYFVQGLPTLFVAALLSGFAATFYMVGTQNLIGTLSKPQQRAQNFANYALMMAVGNFCGPLSAGVAVDHAGNAAAFLWVAAISIVPILLLVFLGAAMGHDKRTSAPAGSVLDSLQVPGIRRVLLTSSLLQAGMDTFQFYIPVYGRAVHLSASEIGFILATCAAAAFISRIFMAALLTRVSEEKLLAYSLYVAAASLVAVPLFSNSVVLAVLSFGFGLGMGYGQPLMTLLTFRISVAGRSGESLGLRFAATNLTGLVGPVVFGFLGSALGLLSVFWASALMLGSGGRLTDRGGARPKA